MRNTPQIFILSQNYNFIHKFTYPDIESSRKTKNYIFIVQNPR